MTREEFERRTGARISDAQWATVHHVYMWHPSIPNAGGKDVIVQLYKIGGMAVITDMDGTATARECMHDQLRDSISEIRETIAGLDARISTLNAELARRQFEKNALMQKVESYQEEFRNMGF